MAKKREYKSPESPEGAAESTGKGEQNIAPPEKSGNVKGPMGVGGRKKPGSKATVKRSSKVIQDRNVAELISEERHRDNSAKITDPSGVKSLDTQLEKKALPEKTSKTDEHLIVSPMGRSSEGDKRKKQHPDSGMHPKDTTPIILEASTKTAAESGSISNPEPSGRKHFATPKSLNKPLTEKVDAEEVKRKIKEGKKEAAGEKDSKPAAKKNVSEEECERN